MKYIQHFEKFYNPPTDIKNKLKKIVSDLLFKHKGGREFFHALDDAIKDVINEDIIISLFKGNSNEWICTSGEFGDRVYKMWKSKKIKCKGVLVFNGKMMTNKTGVYDWYPKEFDINDKQFVYADDSYFSGSTVEKIKSFLSERNSSIKNTIVVYDGSKKKNKNVRSFFRYYDNEKNL